MNLAFAHYPNMLSSKRQQSKMSRAFYGYSQLALVFGTRSSFTARVNLAIISNNAAQNVNVFPIYNLFFIDAKSAYFTSRAKLAPIARSRLLK
jgi:hypothetical protein